MAAPGTEQRARRGKPAECSEGGEDARAPTQAEPAKVDDGGTPGSSDPQKNTWSSYKISPAP
jgi:hypothetical protein